MGGAVSCGPGGESRQVLSIGICRSESITSESVDDSGLPNSGQGRGDDDPLGLEDSRGQGPCPSSGVSVVGHAVDCPTCKYDWAVEHSGKQPRSARKIGMS